MQRTAAVPLRSGAADGLEAEQVEYLIHGDLGTQSVEVNTGHGRSSNGLQDRSVPFLYRGGTGTTLIETLPARRRAAEAAGSFERLQGVPQALVLDGERLTELGAGEDQTWGEQSKHLVR
jgi:hypothetical protein